MFVNSADSPESFFSRCTAWSQSATLPTTLQLWQIIPTTCYLALCLNERQRLLSARVWRFVFCNQMIEVSEKTAGPCLRQNIIIIPPWSWLCQVVLKRPISASLNALHPWRWQPVFAVRALWNSYLKTRRCSVLWNVLHSFLAQKNSWAYKMELWSLAALSTCV
jgi:hypothetical protein